MASLLKRIMTIFGGLIALLVVVYLLFANTLIKQVMEGQLSEAHGAEVNIASVSHTLFPLTVTITGIQVTDPTTPTNNQVQVAQASGDVEWRPLLSNQIVMNQLTLAGVALDTPREQPGEVYRPPQHAFSWQEFGLKAQQAIPSVNDILARAELKTAAAVEHTQTTYATESVKVKEAYAKLPNSERIAEYKAQIEALKQTDYKDPAALAKAQQTLEQLKQEITADKAVLDDFSEQAKLSRTAMAQSLEALRAAPKADYKKLSPLLAGDQAALKQATQLVFGAQAAEYTEYLLSAIQLVVPLLSGDDAAPDATQPAAAMNVLIKQADVDISWQGHQVVSQWRNITNAHALLGKATEFSAKASGPSIGQFVTNGQFWMDKDGVDASQNWTLSAVELAALPLSDNERLNASLTSALMAMKGSLTVDKNRLNVNSAIDLNELKIDAQGEDKIASVIAKTLRELHDLDLAMAIGGTLQAPEFSLTSDLDQRLAQMALTELSATQQDKLARLQSRLNEMTASQSQDSEQQLGEIDALMAAANGDQQQLNDLLSAKLTSIVEDKKDDILNKLKKKLGQ